MTTALFNNDYKSILLLYISQCHTRLKFTENDKVKSNRWLAELDDSELVASWEQELGIAFNGKIIYSNLDYWASTK